MVFNVYGFGACVKGKFSLAVWCIDTFEIVFPNRYSSVLVTYLIDVTQWFLICHSWFKWKFIVVYMSMMMVAECYQHSRNTWQLNY